MRLGIVYWIWNFFPIQIACAPTYTENNNNNVLYRYLLQIPIYDVNQNSIILKTGCQNILHFHSYLLTIKVKAKACKFKNCINTNLRLPSYCILILLHKHSSWQWKVINYFHDWSPSGADPILIFCSVCFVTQLFLIQVSGKLNNGIVKAQQWNIWRENLNWLL